MDARETLRAKLLKKSKEQINEKLAGREIHIIKAVRLLSDLESVSNLLGENANEWKKRAPSGEAENQFNTLEKNSKNIEEEKKSLIEFIEKEMHLEFPHFTLLATPVLGAKLLASAGSKKRLCFMPSSTIQLLGAEKALFAHMRHHAKSPKHGHIFNHPLMQKLPRSKRGSAARTIAGKLSIALKIDYFNGKENAQQMLEELNSEINAIEKEPIDEKKEKEYEEREKRQKEEYEHRNNKSGNYLNKHGSSSEKDFQQKPKTESRTWTPEERRTYFEKMGMRKPEQTKENSKQTLPQKKDNFNRQHWQKNPKYEHTPRTHFQSEKKYFEKKPWQKKPNYDHAPREKNWDEMRYKEKNFNHEGTSHKPWREQRREHSYRPNRNERGFERERNYGEQNNRHFHSRRNEKSFDKERPYPSFHKPHNTKKYRKTRFG